MKNKLIGILWLFLLMVALPLNVSAGGSTDDSSDDPLAFEKRYTDDGCVFTRSECRRYDYCLWIEEKDCGINKNLSSYTCYYFADFNYMTAMVTAYFGPNGFYSGSYITDDNLNAGHKVVVNGVQSPIVVEEASGLSYYTCPEKLYYSSSATESKFEDNVNVWYRAFSTNPEGASDVFNLLKYDSYNGMMMLKEKPGVELPEVEVLTPIKCSYTKAVGNDQRTIEITYHDRNNVSATYTGIVVSGWMNEVNVSAIRRSQYFKDWVCPPENSVYAYVDDDMVLHVAYDRESLGDHNNIFEYQGTNPTPDDQPDTPNVGDPVTGCEVIPESIREWISGALNFVKYIVLVVVIVLGVVDFLQAAGSGEAEAMKKAGTSFLKRIIAVIILFLLPLIVDLVLNLIDIYGADSTCLPN
ncbi:MAG: hypothetical protein E7173_01485 [Firmicutes bacterium]|nr:hypothetical protein [Bacillota bacterium]